MNGELIQTVFADIDISDPSYQHLNIRLPSQNPIIQLSTNSDIVLKWAHYYLSPYFLVECSNPHNTNKIVGTVIATVSNQKAKKLVGSRGLGTNVDIHYNKKAKKLLLDDKFFFSVVNEDKFYLIDNPKQVYHLVTDDTCFERFKEPIRIVRELLICALTGFNCTKIHAACVNIGQTGILLLGDSRSGKTTTMLKLVSNYGANFVSNDKCLIERNSVNSSIKVFGLPYIILIGLLTMLSTPLDNMVRRGEFFDIIQNPNILNRSSKKKLLFTPQELEKLLNRKLQTESIIRYVIYLKRKSTNPRGCLEVRYDANFEYLIRNHLEDDSFPRWFLKDSQLTYKPQPTAFLKNSTNTQYFLFEHNFEDLDHAIEEFIKKTELSVSHQGDVL